MQVVTEASKVINRVTVSHDPMRISNLARKAAWREQPGIQSLPMWLREAQGFQKKTLTSSYLQEQEFLV